MAKLYTYIFITVGMILLFNLAGLVTTSGYVLGQLGININDIENISATPFWVAVALGLTTLAGVSGIRIGTFGTPTTSIFASAIFAIPLLVLVADMLSIIQQSTVTGVTWVSYIIFLIMTPLMLGYGLSLFEWARGTD